VLYKTRHLTQTSLRTSSRVCTEVFRPEEGPLILAYRNVEVLDFKWLCL